MWHDLPLAVQALVTLVAFGVLGMLALRILEMRASVDDRVNHFNDAPPIIMSREAAIEPPSIASSLGTDGPDGRTDAPKISPADLLTFYAWLRCLGAKRDEARAMLRLVGLPVSNDLWSQAAPPPKPADDEILTPIARRPTKARYYDDPELEYQEPTA